MAFGQYSGGIGAVVGAVVGGIIGNYTVGVYQGAMLGASLGGMAGGIAGSVFWPEKIDINHPLPPKPHENRVQVSTYGNSIPIVYQSARVAGNIIYMSDVNKTVERSKHRQDGVRYYELVVTYTSTFAIAFSEGPVVGLARIWINGKIFADYRDPASPYYPSGSIALASANLDTTVARAAAYYSVYLGTETQTADAALTALLTAAETPTYRGIFYIVFRDFPVGEFSGVPTIEVEIDYAVSNTCSEYFTGADDALPSSSVYSSEELVGVPAPVLESNQLKIEGDSGDPIITRYIKASYRSKFYFTGEFDFNIVFSFSEITETIQGSIKIDMTGGYNISYVWGDGTFPAFLRYYTTVGDSYDEVSTSDFSGILRLKRDSLSNIYAYYWNGSSWEWDGDSGGYFIGNDDSFMDILATFSIEGSGKLLIDKIEVTTGCSGAGWA